MQIGLLQMLDSPLMVYVVQYHGIRIVRIKCKFRFTITVAGC